MAPLIMSGLVIITGAIAAGVGVVMVRSAIRVSQRASRKTITSSPAVVESWSAWFLGGFASLSTGLRWVSAVCMASIWTIAGIGLIVLGMQLFERL